MRTLVIALVLSAAPVALGEDAYRTAVDAEVAHHKDRRARLLDLYAKAVAQEKPGLVDRIQKIREKEDRRHLKALARIKRDHTKAAKDDARHVAKDVADDDAKRTKVVKKPRGETR